MAAPPPSHLFKKPNVQVLEPAASRTQHRKPSKSCSSFFSKSLVILLVLVVIPLFPSQAPDFFNQTILTKFWELFHLLFIGIAVSYGLFSRRSVKMEIEDHSRPHTSNLSYLSGISNVSSFFEDGFHNLCFSDEKKMMHTLDPHYLYSESVFKGSSASDEGKNLRSFTLRNDSENISESNGENVSHTWNSRYFPGESLVVVTDGNYTLEKHKPLGLPIRSLRSRIPGAEKLQFAYRNGSSSSMKSCSNNENEVRVDKIKGMTPTNLRNKFEEVTRPSTIPWKSRSVRMETREDAGNGDPPGHSRPHSVGEFEFMQLNSRSFVRPVSSSSKSSKSSVSPELSDMKTGNSGNKIDLNSSVEAKGFSTGSSSELDMQEISEDEFKDFRRGGKQHLLGGAKPGSDPVSPDAKPSNLSKILSRAKSVRTFRSGKYVMDKMKRKDKVGAVDDQFAAAAPILVNTQTIDPKDPPPPPPVDIQKHNSDKDNHPLMSPVFPEYQNRENQHPVDSDLASEEDSESQCESCNDQDSSDENENEIRNGNISAEIVHEDLAGSEVDRKADEFIAKFREQIRLQKIASVRKQSSC